MFACGGRGGQELYAYRQHVSSNGQIKNVRWRVLIQFVRGRREKWGLVRVDARDIAVLPEMARIFFRHGMVSNVFDLEIARCFIFRRPRDVSGQCNTCAAGLSSFGSCCTFFLVKR